MMTRIADDVRLEEPSDAEVDPNGTEWLSHTLANERDHWRRSARRLGAALLAERLYNTARSSTFSLDPHRVHARAITRLDGPNGETHKLALEAVRERSEDDE